jgi:hypothetical protein
MQVGSNSHQGAGSLQLGDNLARITRALFPDAPADAHQVQHHLFQYRKTLLFFLYGFAHGQPGDGHSLVCGQHGHGAWRAPELRGEARGTTSATAAAGAGDKDE